MMSHSGRAGSVTASGRAQKTPRTGSLGSRSAAGWSGGVARTPAGVSGSAALRTPGQTAASGAPGSSRPTGASMTGGSRVPVPDDYLLATAENRHREVGIALMSPKSATIILSQFKDNSSYSMLLHLLETYDPTEIILPHTMEGSSMHAQLQTSNFCSGFITPASRLFLQVKRHHFNDNKGLEQVMKIATAETRCVVKSCEQKYLALSAFHALVKYTEFAQSYSYASKSCRIEYKCPTAYIQLDMMTTTNLELVRNLRDSKMKKGSLFGVTNFCSTSMGQRLLWTSILQPLSSKTQKEAINNRLDFVELLIGNGQAFFELSDKLPKCPDLEYIVASCLVQIPKYGTQCGSAEKCQTLITKVLGLKKAVCKIEEMHAALASLDDTDKPCALLQLFREALSSPMIDELRSKIDMVLDDSSASSAGNASAQIQRCFAVRPGRDALLDVARATFNDNYDDISNLIQRYRDEFGIGSLKIAFSASRGYHVSAKCDADALPPIFIQVYKKGKTVYATTEDLASLSQLNTNAVQEIYILTGAILEDLVAVLRTYIGVLLKMADAVALLDMLRSFAHLVSISDTFCRPEFADGPLAIRAGRHPMAESFANKEFVPNNTMISPTTCSLSVITGPNMAGKSSYIKQVALITILSHIGSFVPAEYAHMPPVDKIFARIGTSDSILGNASTFYLEMQEMALIIQNATPDSLIIIDELGRGTSNQDGVGIAWASCENLIALRAPTLFATHYNDLVQLAKIYPNCQNLHLGVEQSQYGFRFLHRVQKGVAEECCYGLYAAERAGFPQEVVDQARHIRSVLVSNKANIARHVQDDTSSLHSKMNLFQKLVEVSRNSTLDEDSLRDYLQALKDRFFVHSPVTQPSHEV